VHGWLSQGYGERPENTEAFMKAFHRVKQERKG